MPIDSKLASACVRSLLTICMQDIKESNRFSSLLFQEADVQLFVRIRQFIILF